MTPDLGIYEIMNACILAYTTAFQLFFTSAKHQIQHGHPSPYIPVASVSEPTGHGRLPRACQSIPEETVVELTSNQAAGARPQTARKCSSNMTIAKLTVCVHQQ